MGFAPNVNDMARHLAALFDWTTSQYPDARFEIRAIHPNGIVHTERFACSQAGYDQAIRYAVQKNNQGFNAYVTANPLKPDTDHAANDTDVEIAVYHYIDIDGVDDPAALLADRAEGFTPTLIVRTGSVPKPRCQVYWRQREPITDMAVWRNTQAGLAQRFETDVTVKNPSRVLRLAGSISYPPERKQKRGYVTETTALDRIDGGDVCDPSFAALFAPVAPPRATPEPVMDRHPITDGPARLPLCVIEAALAAIPHPTQRNDWLDLAYAVKDANPNAHQTFEDWRSTSSGYDAKDDIFDSLRPAPNSYLSLLARAKQADPDWWRKHSGEVYDWGCLQAMRLNQAQTDTAEDGDPLEQPQSAPASDDEQSTGPAIFAPFEPMSLRNMNLTDIQPRRWVYGRFLVRGYVSCFAGSGGTGKTSLASAISLSVALGRSLLALEDTDQRHRVHKKGAVFYFNLEDQLDEMQLRFAAEIKHRHVRQSELEDVYVASGRDHPFCVASLGPKGQIVRHDITPAVKLLKRLGVVLLTVDPLVNAHTLDGNRNDYLAVIIDQFRRIAHEADCAVLLVHHFRKGGQSGDVEASLGAVTLTNSCRVVDTVAAMSEDQAKQLGIDTATRRRYVQCANAKLNLSPAPTECDWFEFNGVALDNGTDEYPEGDSVGVLRRWKPIERVVPWSFIETCLNSIASGEDGERYSDTAAGKPPAYAMVMLHTGLSEAHAKQRVKDWLKDGVLKKAPFRSPKSRKTTDRLFVVPEGKEALRKQMDGA